MQKVHKGREKDVLVGKDLDEDLYGPELEDGQKQHGWGAHCRDPGREVCKTRDLFSGLD